MTMRYVLIGILIVLAVLLAVTVWDAVFEAAETGQIESPGVKPAE
jgi:hypothetical protein